MRDTTARRFMIIAGVVQVASLLLAALLAIFTGWRPSDAWIVLTDLALMVYLMALMVYFAPQ